MLLLLIVILLVDNVKTCQENDNAILPTLYILQSAEQTSAFLWSNPKSDACDREQEVQDDMPEIDEFNARKKDHPSSDLSPLVIKRTFFGASTILASEKLPVNPPPELS